MSIRFEKVSKRFGTKSVLQEISFEVHKGEIFFIIGKSGVGKSVTLKLIIGLLKPDIGCIHVNEKEVTQLKMTALAAVRKQCGLVFQHPALLDSLTVYENVAFGLNSVSSDLEKLQIVKKNLTAVNLDSKMLNRYPPELSFGMQKRVSIARTLAPSPSILLFDEPTTALDPISTQTIGNLVLNLSKNLKTTTLVVSHDMEWALKIADRILVLEEGAILALDTPQNIRRSQATLIQEFLLEVQK